MLDFYDFEVFSYNWHVRIINPVEKISIGIWDDPDKLINYFETHKNDIWIGYNNRRYDQYIAKGIMLGFDPKEINDWIIKRDLPGWQYSSVFNKITMINFDTMLKTDTGLKPLEAFMGNDIRETEVPFDIDRPLTDEEKAQTEFYCNNDVEQTIEVWLNRKAEFDAAMDLVKIFNLPLSYMGKTGAQRVAKILGGNSQKITGDQFQFQIVPTLRLSRYQALKDWYRNPENQDYEKSQIAIICGIPHTLAWGGLHGAIGEIRYRKEKPYIKTMPYYGEGIFIMSDVTAYYPSLQLRYKLGYRSMSHPENFEKIHGENLRFKRLGDKKARLPYKIADNAISGQLKDVNSSLFDPRENNAVCVNGQLLLVDLLEKLEPHIEALIQSNTDGILFKISSWDDFDKIDDIVWEWEKRTGMRMEFSIYTKVFQKDVNNYLLIGAEGKTKTKGSYTKSLSAIDNDLPIINKALVDYMTKNIPLEKTIRDCKDLIMFQKVVKLTGKYWRAWHNQKYMTEKCYRVFASTDKHDTYIGKCKSEGATIEKFANTPEHCFINNTNIHDMSIPNNLDKDWYINLAKTRLEQYGVNLV